MSGFVTNPMEHAEASKIAIYGVASYSWNPEKYDSEKTWKDAIKNIMPASAEELEFFAAHNSDLGKLTDTDIVVTNRCLATRCPKVYRQLYKRRNTMKTIMPPLQETFGRMAESGDILLTDASNLHWWKKWNHGWHNSNCWAKQEKKSRPWQSIRKRQSGTVYAQIQTCKALQQQMFQIDQTYNQNPYQPGG